MTEWTLDPAPKAGEIGLAVAALIAPGATFELAGSDLKDLRVFNGTAPDQAAIEARITASRAVPPVKEPTLADVVKVVRDHLVDATKPEQKQAFDELAAKLEATKGVAVAGALDAEP